MDRSDGDGVALSEITSVDLEMVPLQGENGDSANATTIDGALFSSTATLRQKNGINGGGGGGGVKTNGNAVHVFVSENDVEGLKQTIREEDVRQSPQRETSVLNVQDDKGRTALHLAVELRLFDIVRFLADRDDVDYSLQDHRKDTALHVAVRTQDNELIRILLDGCDDDDAKRVDVLGLNNKTPLALAVQLDNVEIVEQLINAGADPLQGDLDGMTPAGLVVIKGDVALLKILFRHAESSEHQWNAISLCDGSVGTDDATVLHLGVESSAPEVVEFLLAKPVKIDARKLDGSTALHLACANGQLEIVKLLINYSKEKSMKDELMNMRNDQDHLAIHRAAVFDRDDVITFLLEEGSDIEVELEGGLSLLLVAVASGASKTANLLLSKGADPLAKDSTGQGLLHKSVSYSRTLQALITQLGRLSKKLVNLQDQGGCTALHYAAEGGYNQAASVLLENKADCSISNSQLELPLHMAVSNGHLLVVITLANHLPRSIDLKNINGRTGLHLSCINGHINVLDYLLQMGAAVTRDDEGKTPLHFACESGSLGCLELLLEYWKEEADAVDSHKDTALHLAAKGGHGHLVTMLLDQNTSVFDNSDDMNALDVALEANDTEGVLQAFMEHSRWREFMKPQGDREKSQLQILMEASPQAAKKLLDNCVISQNQPEEKNFKNVYEFTYLQGVTDKESPIPFGQSMATLKHMVERKIENCLAHPVSVTFLNSKWRRLGWTLYIFNLLVYSTFLALLTTYVVGYFPYPHCDENVVCHRDVPIRYVILAFSALNLLKELSQLWSNHIYYFLEFTNILEWALYSMAIVFMNPGGVIFRKDSENCCPSSVWVVGAIAIFLAWMNMVLFWRRFAQFGLYVVMISTMVITLIKVIAVVALLVFSYGIVFLLLFRNKTDFKDLGVAVLKAFDMTLGDFGYTDILPAPDQNITANEATDVVFFNGPAYFMFICFALSMIVIVSNLLIGLAVGDIGAVQKGAVIERLSMQVELIGSLEDSIPRFLAKYLNHCIFTETVEHPNQTQTIQKLFVSNVVDNVTIEEAKEEENENDKAVRTLMNESENLVEKTKSLALRLDRQMDLLMSLTNTLSKHQGVTVGDEYEEEGEDEDDDQQGVDIASFVARAGAAQRSQAFGRGMEGDFGQENDYV
ncbi:transient receptor potential cation channel subfamily A member 1-like isoform X2 [Oscarella lobularis]|uniref:transient receptor potential cation channel subfamily A member 1-like isoform X2 n=1 Tax=Oscarella lobularis TaxID=121494 RepID=UPI0033139B19